jgi:hypothetical protein
VPRLLFHTDAEQDLDDLAASQPKLAARLAALLAETAADPALLDMLTALDYDPNHPTTRRILQAYADL